MRRSFRISILVLNFVADRIVTVVMSQSDSKAPVTPGRGRGLSLQDAVRTAVSSSPGGLQDGYADCSAASSAPAARAEVATVAFKLPPFWPHDPVVWFSQAESQFRIRGITQQQTKFDYVVTSIAPEYAVEIRDLLMSRPDHEPYNVLRRELIKRTQTSEQRRLRQLLTEEELGDRKPSQLLRRLRQLQGESAMDTSFLRELFVQRLPANAQMVLASTPPSMSLEALAELADRVMEVSHPVVAEVARFDTQASQLDQLTAQVASLQEQMKALTTSLSSSHRPRSRSRSGRRHASRPSSPADSANDESDLCYYHRKFGQNALKCVAPCRHLSGNGQASSQ